MINLSYLDSKRVFELFEEICAVPRGSGNMEGVADYCMAFAQKNGLKALRDTANNVCVFKSATSGYEAAEPVILQGHLDIVCQKREDSNTDFLKDGIKPYIDGDYIRADGTTLGADNGIAVAMILVVLESKDISHPAIEAVFTTDEEIGMIGASLLEASALKAKRMINLDSETEGVLTVSCAGGTRFEMSVPFERKTFSGTKITLIFSGLMGGHSGVEIDKGRVNVNKLTGRVLNYLKSRTRFELISVNGGDKDNAIANRAVIELCTNDTEALISLAGECTQIIKKEISAREPNFKAELIKGDSGEYSVIDSTAKDKLICALICSPNGIIEMSAEINGLVETSLNLGVLATQENEILLCFALRSNKNSALRFLTERLTAIADAIDIKYESSGFYPPWEFKENSYLQKICKEVYTEQYGKELKVEAIHAGLECGMFSSKIEGLDCVSMGPDLFDVHTVNEHLSIKSTERVYKLLLKILEKLK